MIFALVFELLPARGLDQSMLLPVLIGLLVVLLFTELFGWVFAGAVVPGYLASVLVIQPVTGAIVVFESLLTLAIATVLAKSLSRSDAWTRFFGRERFFLILAVSLVVRIHDHAWLAPWMIAQLDQLADTQLETGQDFYSVGLVLVPLTANMLWKPAIHRGLLQLGVQVGMTYLIVALVLLPYTNLSLTSVELTYENAALYFVDHAKAHIILLSAALLAARLNLTYGWDFNGILVPALLALLWLTPLKLMVTLGEGIVVFHLARGFLALPHVRHLDLEGPRKIVIVFALAFAWKLTLGFALGPVVPDFKVSDAYGFGYLLSSLLAVKMLAKKSSRAVLLPSMMTSAGGFVIGSVAGFVLELISPQPPGEAPIEEPQSQRLVRSPLGVVTLARVQTASFDDDSPEPSPNELHQLQRFWTAASAGPDDPATESDERGPEADGDVETSLVDSLAAKGAALGLQVVTLGEVEVGSKLGEEAGEEAAATAPGDASEPPLDAGRSARPWFGIVEQGTERSRGWPTGLLSPEGEGPVLVVPMPASEAPVAEAAAVLCRRVDCKAVLVAGSERALAGSKFNPRPLELAMEAFDERPMVVLRGGEARGWRPSEIPAAVLARPGQRGEAVASEPGRAQVHILRGNFDAFDLWPQFDFAWEPRETVVRMPRGGADFALLVASAADYQALVNQSSGELLPRREGERAGPLEVDPDQLLVLLDEIMAKREPLGHAGAAYHPPSEAELQVLEQLIVEPLARWAQAGLGPPPPLVRTFAALIDYELVELGECGGLTGPDEGVDGCLVMLRELGVPSTAGWGTLVLRRGPARELTIEVPRPHREWQTWRVGTELWQITRARALLIAGADGLPDDPYDFEDDPAPEMDEEIQGSDPDPARLGNLATPFQAFHQALERVSGGQGALELVQLRGLGSHRTVESDMILGCGRPAGPGETCADSLSPTMAELIAEWGSCRMADGSEQLYVLSGAGNPQVEYTRELAAREARVLWLSASLRDRFAELATTSQTRALSQAGFTLETRRELQRLLAPLFPASSSQGEPVGRAGFEEAVDLAVAYAETDNLHLLRELLALEAGAADLQISAGLGRDWGRAYLFIEQVDPLEPARQGHRALVFLGTGSGRRVVFGGAELVLDPVGRLQRAALRRPRVIELRDLPVRELGGRP